MFLVPVRLARSPIHGFGVFAAERIPAGTRVWEFTEGVDYRIPDGDVQRAPEPYRSELLKYAYKDSTGDYVLCGDAARFMNHSDQPSCDDTGDFFTVAIHDIAIGQELTCDYRSFDMDWEQYGERMEG
jgi:SET domain-containing protein